MLGLFWKIYAQKIVLLNGIIMDLSRYGFLHYCRPVDQVSNTAKTAKADKENDDSHSTTSYDYTLLL